MSFAIFPRLPILAVLFLPFSGAAMAENRIDIVRPDAPDLAAYGSAGVGVTTVTVTNPNQIDVINATAGAEPPRADRALTLEIFYPADPQSVPTPLTALLRDGTTSVELAGRASRDAAPFRATAPYPLVIVSHGYPGNRFLLSPLAENLASKGYVVASIDHLDSTYDNQAAFGSTLVNRPLDQMFVLNEMERLSAGATGPLAGLVDTERTAVIGYSMGGYGTLISAGAGVTTASTEYSWGAAAGTLERHIAGSESHEALIDPRLKAIIAIGPWGRNRDFWDAAGLAGLRVPSLIVAGSKDDVSGYENGIRKIWEEAKGTDRLLLTFDNANHNAGAPMPAPAESFAFSEKLGFAPFEHYADPVWDSVRMNNILQHFSTAFLGLHLGENAEMTRYLELVPRAEDGTWAKNEDGTPKPEHSYWTGFANRTAVGLSLERLSKGQ